MQKEKIASFCQISGRQLPVYICVRDGVLRRELWFVIMIIIEDKITGLNDSCLTDPGSSKIPETSCSRSGHSIGDNGCIIIELHVAMKTSWIC